MLKCWFAPPPWRDTTEEVCVCVCVGGDRHGSLWLVMKSERGTIK